MDRISIIGGSRLTGTIPISGAKNAALPLMIASLLTGDRLTLKNVPNLADVNLLARILRNHGVDLTIDGKRADPSPHLGETFHLTARDVVDTTAPYEMVNRMRASFWVLGPLLARCGSARVSMPGGCAIGTRPVDLHLIRPQGVGCEHRHRRRLRRGQGAQAPKGASVVFPKVSVGATHTVMMSAPPRRGETVIENAAREPEVGDVAECLVKMGAKIEGIGTRTLRIQGRDRLEGDGPYRAARPHRDRNLRASPWQRPAATLNSRALARACWKPRSQRSSRRALRSPTRRPACALPATAASCNRSRSRPNPSRFSDRFAGAARWH